MLHGACDCKQCKAYYDLQKSNKQEDVMSKNTEYVQSEEDFEPFGPEWEKEMMKLPKKIIIDMLKNEFKKSKNIKNT